MNKMKLEDVFQWQTISGDPTTVGDVTVTPQSQALTIRWPYGGAVWNRPTAVRTALRITASVMIASKGRGGSPISGKGVR